MLLTAWFTDPHRAARGLALLGFGDPSPETMVAAFERILASDVEDGVDFDLDAVRVDRIRVLQAVTRGAIRRRLPRDVRDEMRALDSFFRIYFVPTR